MMELTRRGHARLKEWVALITEQGWSQPDKCFLVDYWLAHHDEDGIVIAKGHPLYKEPSRGGDRSDG
jgi:hypothetical protein